MREAFHDQLESIFGDLADIARQVQEQVAQATEALLEGNAEIAEQVISNDAKIDAARERVEDLSFSLLSLQQPVAGDLRTLVAGLRMAGDLERMGDLAVHVAKIARLRVPDRAVPTDVEPTIRKMAMVAELMTGKVADIISDRDVAGAAELHEVDEQMDQLRRKSFRELLGADWQHGIEPAVDLALLGRYYERIADHAVSVANRVVYVVTGQPPAPSEA
jgi:phosphate transport system protein